MAERRQGKRIATQLRAWCEGDDFTLLAQVLNVSRGGLFVLACQGLPPGRRFSIALEELGTSAEVEVKWTRGPDGPSRSGAGVEIVSFHRGKQDWNRYIDRSTSRSGEHVIAWREGTEDD